jgi:hypothetical protein
VPLLLSIISEGLKFLNEFQANRLRERVINLRERFNEEMAKGSLRDDAALDSYERELRELGELFLASIKSATLKD